MSLNQKQIEDKELKLLKALEEEKEYRKYNKFFFQFPLKEGKYSRDKYPVHWNFMSKGADYKQRAMVAANRVGKTNTAIYEAVAHLTGIYPEDWTGYKFNRPIDSWACGVSTKVIKLVLQEGFLGPLTDMGTGMIPKSLIVDTFRMPGGANQIQTIHIRHKSGGISTVEFKSFEEERAKFQGAKIDLALMDEECKDVNIYSEILTRLSGGSTTDDGLLIATFTPLLGLSDVAATFCPKGVVPLGGVSEEFPYKFVTGIGWDDVPHLSERWKKETEASYSPHERLARTQGLISLGSGAVYPHDPDSYTVEPFEIPSYWPRFGGLDVGFAMTACVWMALDRDTGIIYAYSEYGQAKTTPVVHASAIKARGKYIPIATDPHAGDGSQADGISILEMFQAEDVNVFSDFKSNRSVEAGIYKIEQLLQAKQFKIFSSLTQLLQEMRLYHRDEKNQVVKKNDHYCDASRYGVFSALDAAVVPPNEVERQRDERYDMRSNIGEGFDSVTGY